MHNIEEGSFWKQVNHLEIVWAQVNHLEVGLVCDLQHLQGQFASEFHQQQESGCKLQ